MPVTPSPFHRRLLDACLLSRCLLCGGLVRGWCPICLGCERSLPWNRQSCIKCAVPLAVSGVCGDCLENPPGFVRTCCAFRYEPPVSVLLNRYKHQGDLACGHWLGHGLAGAVATAYAGQGLPDCLLPVPLHWRRLQVRGFNQAREVGRVLARQLAIPLVDGALRRRATHSQQGQGRSARQRNLAGAFGLRRSFRGQTVAILDDVLTTGSTANALAAELLAGGAAEVHVWAIARTP